MVPRLFLTLLLALAACAAPASVQTDSAEPVTLTDDAGRSVVIPADVERIVSLAPSNTEIVCAVGACDRLVGVTDFDDFPPEISDVPDVVVAAQVDVEKVVAAEPDLILAAGNELTPSSVIEQLTELGYPVLSLYPESLDEVYADITLVGRAVDASAAAEEVVDGMRSRVADIGEALAGAQAPQTFYEVSVFEGIIYTAGEDSFLESLIELAGGEPITGDALTTSIALEELVAADPELILLGDASYDPTLDTPEEALAAIEARPGWGDMTAVREGNVEPVLDDIVITRPGPRVIDGLEALARIIHPDRFE